MRVEGGCGGLIVCMLTPSPQTPAPNQFCFMLVCGKAILLMRPFFKFNLAFLFS